MGTLSALIQIRNVDEPTAISMLKTIKISLASVGQAIIESSAYTTELDGAKDGP